MAAFVKFWGTRGSIPTPASWTRVYGGNTPCVEVRFDDSVFICDAGSGIRELGKDLLERRPRPDEAHLFITHTHWDHIQGFPFFAPVYEKTMKIRVYGRESDEISPFQVLSGQMTSVYFPVSFKDLGACIIDDRLKDGKKKIDGVLVRSFPLNHPGGCQGYIFEKDGRKIVYATDHELEIAPGAEFPDPENTGALRRFAGAMAQTVEGADLLIIDSQYDDQEYAAKMGWGHSSCFSVTDFAIQARVKALALFHHDPESTDRSVDRKVELCRERAARHNAGLTIMAAREGVELKY